MVAGQFLLPLCLTTESFLLMQLCLEEGGLKLGFGRQGEHLLPWWIAMANANRPDLTECAGLTDGGDGGDGGDAGEFIIKEVVRRVYAANPAAVEDALDEIRKDSELVRIETINGKPYLEEDCGCGERKYYALTEAQIDPRTGAIAGELDTVPGFIEEIPLSPGNATCYADKVASIITDALVAYTDAVFNYAVAGSLAFAPKESAALLGAVEIQQAIASALNGNLQLDFSDVGYTANEVKAAFRGTPFQEFLKARLGDDQKVSRFVLELVQVRLNANFGLNFPTPLAPVFGAWIKTTNIRALNLALQKAAIECESGNSEPVPFTVETDGVYDFYIYRTPRLKIGEVFPVLLPPQLPDWTSAVAVISNRTELNAVSGGVASFVLRPVGTSATASNIAQDAIDLGALAARDAARAANVIPPPPTTIFATNTLWQTAPTAGDEIEMTPGGAPSGETSYIYDFAIVVPV